MATLAKRILLIAAGGYVLGFVGLFIVNVMELWDLGPAIYVAGEAAARALIWPYEVVKLFY